MPREISTRILLDMHRIRCEAMSLWDSLEVQDASLRNMLHIPAVQAILEICHHRIHACTAVHHAEEMAPAAAADFATVVEHVPLSSRRALVA